MNQDEKPQFSRHFDNEIEEWKYEKLSRDKIE